MAEMEALHSQLEQLLAQNNRLLQQNAELQSQANISATASSVRPKLAPFWQERPAGWFAHIEAQFALAHITTDETKYNYVVSQIDSRLSREVEDLVINPPPKGQRYEWIKDEMIRRFSTSESLKVRQLISGEELGDRKPTQFLRHLKSLAGNTFSDDKILRELWLQRLPRNAQAILTAQSDLPLDKVAELADKILEVNPIAIAAAVATPTSLPHSTTPDLSDLALKLQELTKQVAALTADRSRQRSRSKSNNRFPRAATPETKSGICWYHTTYSSKALKCVQPCSWSGNQPGNQ